MLPPVEKRTGIGWAIHADFNCCCQVAHALIEEDIYPGQTNGSILNLLRAEHVLCADRGGAGIKPVTIHNAAYGIQRKMQELALWAARKGLLDAYATGD